MSTSTALDLNRITGVLARVQNIESKALLVEKEVGLDNIYTLISMGEKLSNIASSIGLSLKDIEYILKRTPEHIKRYTAARLSNVADSSLKRLDDFSFKSQLDEDESRGSKHHLSVVDMTIKTLHSMTGGDDQVAITVNNQYNVNVDQKIPELPDELKDVIDVDIG